jgi:hypothetical protein
VSGVRNSIPNLGFQITDFGFYSNFKDTEKADWKIWVFRNYGIEEIMNTATEIKWTEYN